ncbi:hypothetical protein [Aquicoccus sp.]|uniref:hypothetical protein n=1 Tax=Aquicoccus sp. TaxID=2055851 RepID=UPI003561A95C
MHRRAAASVKEKLINAPLGDTPRENCPGWKFEYFLPRKSMGVHVFFLGKNTHWPGLANGAAASVNEPR